VDSEYLFDIRAVDWSDNEESNAKAVLSQTYEIPALNNAMAYISEPRSGAKIEVGSKVTVSQRVIFGGQEEPVPLWNRETVPDTFEMYGSSYGSSLGSPTKLCLDCHLPFETQVSAMGIEGAEHDFADSLDPEDYMVEEGNLCEPCHSSTATRKNHVRDYIKIWNTAGLSAGNYRLRTVVKDANGVDDPNPPFITVTLVDSGGDVNEGTNAQGERVKAVAAFVGSASAIRMASNTGLTYVGIPAGALTTDTTVDIREVALASAPPVPGDYVSAGEFRELTLASGQTSFEGGNKAIVAIPYPDTDGDGVVDGTNTSAYDMQVCRQNGASWQCLDSFASTGSRAVRAETDGFSVFGLMAPPKIFGSGAWNMVSVPLTPVPNTPYAVFGSVTSNWNYVLRWDPSIGDYAVVSAINPGESYLVYGNGGSLGSVAGTETPDEAFSIPISAGWNMIGHPFRYKVAVSGVQVNYSGFDYSLDEAEANGWLFATLFKLSADGSSYEREDTTDGVLEPWKGYWIYSDIDCTLIIPNTPVQ
jgi:hypothetical protein